MKNYKLKEIRDICVENLIENIPYVGVGCACNFCVIRDDCKEMFGDKRPCDWEIDDRQEESYVLEPTF